MIKVDEMKLRKDLENKTLTEREIASKHQISTTKVNDYRHKFKIFKFSRTKTTEYRTQLEIKAELFWKTQEVKPEKGSLSWLLIPEFGKETTEHLLLVRAYLLKNKSLKEVLLNVKE